MKKKFPGFSWCYRFLTSKWEEVTSTETSPFRIKVSIPYFIYRTNHIKVSFIHLTQNFSLRNHQVSWLISCLGEWDLEHEPTFDVCVAWVRQINPFLFSPKTFSYRPGVSVEYLRQLLALDEEEAWKKFSVPFDLQFSDAKRTALDCKLSMACLPALA